MSPCHKAQHSTDELDRISGEKTQQLNPRPLRLPVGGGRGHVPKAQGLKRRGRGLRPCDRKGAGGG